MLLLLPLLCCIGWFLYRHHKAAKERDEQANLVTVDVEGQRNYSNSGPLTEPMTILRRSDDDKYLTRPLETLPNGGATTLVKPSNGTKKFGLIRTKTVETDDDVATLEPVLADTTPRTNSSTDTSLSNKAVTIIAPSEKHELQTEMFAVKHDPKVLPNSKEEDSVDDKPIDSASRKSSTPSGGSSPTIWDAFKILGMQYIKRHSIKSRRSSSASLEELIRAREQKKTPSVTPRLESTTK
uniref:EGF-like domain-containing protein n=1 Tax=Parascaris univalens TaxID=6257 RepID=A0A915CB89_PARUN